MSELRPLLIGLALLLSAGACNSVDFQGGFGPPGDDDVLVGDDALVDEPIYVLVKQTSFAGGVAYLLFLAGWKSAQQMFFYLTAEIAEKAFNQRAVAAPVWRTKEEVNAVVTAVLTDDPRQIFQTVGVMSPGII